MRWKRYYCHLTHANCVGTCNGQWCTNLLSCNSPTAPIAPAPTPVSAPTISSPQTVVQPTGTQPLFNPTPPTPTNVNIANTTRYWHCSGGACGCGSLCWRRYHERNTLSWVSVNSSQAFQGSTFDNNFNSSFYLHSNFLQ